MDWDSLRARPGLDAGPDVSTPVPGQFSAVASWNFSEEYVLEQSGRARFADQAPRPPEVTLTFDSADSALFQAGHLVLNGRTLGSDPNSGLALARAVHTAERGFAVELWVQDLPTTDSTSFFGFSDWGLRLTRWSSGISVDLYTSQQQVADVAVTGPFTGRHHLLVSVRRPNGIIAAYLDGELAGASSELFLDVVDENLPTRLYIGNDGLAFVIIQATFFDEPLEEAVVKARFQAGAAPR